MTRENFLYQINFNRNKYPDICEALEKAKEENGIAWYLRELIRKDIESKKVKTNLTQKSETKITEYHKNKQVLEKPKIEKNIKKSLKDTGGFT